MAVPDILPPSINPADPPPAVDPPQAPPGSSPSGESSTASTTSESSSSSPSPPSSPPPSGPSTSSTTSAPSQNTPPPTSTPSSPSTPTPPPTSAQSESKSSASPGPTSAPPSETSSSPPGVSPSPTLPPTRASSLQGSSTAIFQSTQPDGEVVTVTSVVQGSATPTAGLNAQNDNTSKGFFHNKGAVAGVFAAVGVVAIILFIVFVTNAVRRRRAKKFDREVAEAAAEAATAGHRPTDFDDDDFGGYTVNHSVYTGDSHGTYSQQPLQPMESYNMSEIQPSTFDPYAPSVTSAGNAGIGTSLNRAKSQTAPYNAYANPGNSPPHPNMPVPATDPTDPFYDPTQGASMPVPTTSANAAYASGAYGQPTYNPQSSLLEAAGLATGASVGAAAMSGMQAQEQGLQRNKSIGGQTLGGMSGSEHTHDPYGEAVRQYDQTYGATYGQVSYPQPQVQPQPQPYAQPGMPYPEPQHQLEGRPVSMAVSAISGEDPYAGYEDEPSQPQSHSGHGQVQAQGPPQMLQDQHQQFAVSNPHDEDSDNEDDGPYPSYQHIHRDSQVSFRDEIDYGYDGGKRVLRVANE